MFRLALAKNKAMQKELANGKGFQPTRPLRILRLSKARVKRLERRHVGDMDEFVMVVGCW